MLSIPLNSYLVSQMVLSSYVDHHTSMVWRLPVTVPLIIVVCVVVVSAVANLHGLHAISQSSLHVLRPLSNPNWLHQIRRLLF